MSVWFRIARLPADRKHCLDPDPMPQRDVLQDQISQQSSLSSSGFTDDVEVLSFIHGGNAKGLGIAPAWILANDDVGVLIIHGAKTSRHP